MRIDNDRGVDPQDGLPTLLDTLQPSAATAPAAPRALPAHGHRDRTAHAATAHVKPPRNAGGRALGPTLGWAPPRRPIQLVSNRHGNRPPAAHAPPLKTPQEQMALPRRILRGHPNPSALTLLPPRILRGHPNPSALTLLPPRILRGHTNPSALTFLPPRILRGHPNPSALTLHRYRPRCWPLPCCYRRRRPVCSECHARWRTP